MEKEVGKNEMKEDESRSGKQVLSAGWSAPPKINVVNKSQPKMMREAQKAVITEPMMDDAEKVYILEIDEAIETESETDSDSFTIKMRKVGFNVERPSNEDCGGPSKLAWVMDVDNLREDIHAEVFKSKKLNGKDTSEKMGEKDGVTPDQLVRGTSPEVIGTEDYVMNTQESEGIINSQEVPLSRGESRDSAILSQPTESIIDLADEKGKGEINMIVDVEGTQKFDGPPLKDATEEDLFLKERRRSERLKKVTNIPTKEKNERIAKKRNLEGNSFNMFSALHSDVIVDTALDMGIIINRNDFGTFNLLNDLEIARSELHNRQCLDRMETIETAENKQSMESDNQLDWLQKEPSDDENFTIVESRKTKRERKKKVRFSPATTTKSQGPSIPVGTKKEGDLVKSPLRALSKIILRSNNTRSYMELQGP